MNKKTITALSIGAAAVIGAITVVGCDNPFAKKDIKEGGAGTAAGSERMQFKGIPGITDSLMDWFLDNSFNHPHIFANGKDDWYEGVRQNGFIWEGKFYMYSYFQSNNKDEADRLRRVLGLKTVEHNTSKSNEYCWVSVTLDQIDAIGTKGKLKYQRYGFPTPKGFSW